MVAVTEGAALRFEDLSEGLVAEQSYLVTDAARAALVEVFGDRSRLHVDADYARAAGFKGEVVHGAVLQGFLSHFVGMVLPGHTAMLLSVDLRYHQPLYLGDELELRGTVTQRVEAAQVVVLTVEWRRGPAAELVAKGRVQVKVRDA